MTLYDAVKNTVTTLQAAERYGLKVGRGGIRNRSLMKSSAQNVNRRAT